VKAQAEGIEDIEIVHPAKVFPTIPDVGEESSVSKKSDLMPSAIIEEALDDTFESKNGDPVPKPVLEYQKVKTLPTRILPKRININDLKGKKGAMLLQGKKPKNMVKQAMKIVKHHLDKHAKAVEIDPKDVMKEICRLGAGQGFGHEAIFHEGNYGRLGAVKCLTECHILSVTKHDCIKLIKRFDDKEKEESLRFYRNLPYFANWTRTNLLKLMQSFQARFFKKD
jgi:hypothetical protein